MQVRCPHCQETLELQHDSSFENVHCQGCGSSFSLVGVDETTDHVSAPRRRIAHFELIQQLGAGAFGAVWRAKDTELDREVAIKIPRKGQLSTEEVEKFLREARAAAQLKHPGIVSVHEVGRDGDTVYIVSDFIEGITLTDWLSAYRPTPREAAELCARIADALQHAHENGVTHRDLKPGNLMIDRQGDVHLMDFGLAKRDAGEVTMTVDGQVLGTPAYLSPEAARGDSHKADARSDVYSLGVIFFEMLTGERPFRGNSRMLIHQLLTEEAPSPRKLNASIPRDLETICVKCLRKEPERRYDSAKEVAGDLRRWSNGIPIEARPVSRVEKGWLWCRRHKTISVLAAAVLLGLLTTSLALIETERAKQKAEAESERRRRDLYFSQVTLAYKLFEENNYAETNNLLQETAALSDGKFRDFEWYYLWNALEPRRKAQVYSFPNVPTDVRFIDQDSICIGGWSGEVTRHDLTRIDESPVVLLPAEIGQRVLHQNESAKGYKLATQSSMTSHFAYWSEDLTSMIIKSIVNGDSVTIDGVSKETAIEFGREGKIAVVLRESGEVLVIDITSGEVRKSFRVDAAPGAKTNTRIALSADQKWLAVLHTNSSVQLWNFEAGQKVEQLPDLAKQEPHVFQFSPDSKRLAVGTENGPVRLFVFDVETGTVIAERSDHTDAVRALAYSPDGQTLATGSRDNSIRLWNARDLDPIGTLKGHSGIVNDVAFSPDGKKLVSVAQDYTAVIWDVPKVPRFGPSLIETRPRAKTNGKTAFVRENRKLGVFGLDSGKAQLEPELHGRTADAFDVNSTGFVAIAEEDTVDVYAPGIREPKYRFAVHDRVLTLELGEQARRVGYATSGGVVGIYDCQTEINLKATEPHAEVKAIAFDDDFQVMATAGGKWGGVGDSDIYIWDLSKGRPERVRRLKKHLDPVTSLAFSPDGKHLVSSSIDNNIFVWDWQRGEKVAALSGHTASVRQVLFSPSGKRLVSCAGDRTVRFWDWESKVECGKIRLSGDLKGISAIDWVDDDTLFGIDHYGGFHLWDGPVVD